MNEEIEIDVPARWIMKVPVLSTAHVSRECADELDRAAHKALLGDVINMPDGWLIYASSLGAPDNALTNPNLLRLREWAYPKGYEWIRLSPDGDVYDELPTFDW